MKPIDILGTKPARRFLVMMASATMCLVMASGCAGCEDELAAGCTSDEDCRVGRMCIEEACAPAQDAGTPLDDHDAGPGEGDDPRTDVGATDPETPASPSEAMVDEYCAMESACIPVCVIRGGEAACDSTERQTECREDFGRWYDSRASQSTACAQTIDAWIECISAASCGEVEEFFRAHPDGVTESTPCSTAYFKMECIDFEPPTEYGF